MNRNEKTPAATEVLNENVIDQDNSNMVTQDTPKANRLLLAGEQLVTHKNIWKIARHLWDAGYYVLPSRNTVPCFKLAEGEHFYDKDHEWFNPANLGGVWYQTASTPNTLSLWLRNYVLVDDDRPKVHKKIEDGKKPSEKQLANDPVLAALVDSAELAELFQYGEPSEPSGLRSKHLMYKTTMDVYSAMLRGEFKQAYPGFEFDIKTGNQLVHIKLGKTINLDNLLNAPAVPQEVLNILAAAPKSPNKGTVKKERGAEEYESVDDTSWAKPEWILTQEGLRAASKTGDASEARWNIGIQVVAAGFSFSHYASLPFAKELIAQKGIGWLRDTEWANLVDKNQANQEEIDTSLFKSALDKELDALNSQKELPEYNKQFTSRTPIITGFMNFSSVWGMVAASSTGKTFVMLGMMARASLGKPVGNRATMPSHNFYFGAEGRGGLPIRRKALERAYNNGEPIERLHLKNPFDFELSKQEGWIELMQYMINESKGEPVGIVAFDTLNSLGSVIVRNWDPNSGASMQYIANKMQMLVNALGCAAGVIHHPNQTDKLKSANEQRFSGSDVYFNAADYMYAIHHAKQNGKSKLLSLWQHKEREGNRANNFSVELQFMDLGDHRTSEEIEEDKRAKSLLSTGEAEEFASSFPEVKHAVVTDFDPNTTLFLVPHTKEYVADVYRQSSTNHKTRTDEAGEPWENQEPAKPTEQERVMTFIRDGGKAGVTFNDVKRFCEDADITPGNRGKILSDLKKKMLIIREEDNIRASLT